MTTESQSALWTLQDLLDLFDVPFDGSEKITADTGLAGADDRQVVEGTQVLAQAIVAVAKRFAGQIGAVGRPRSSAVR